MNDSDTSESVAFKKVAFLDTNTLHYIGLYLEYAKENTLYPMGEKLTEIEKNAAKNEVDKLMGTNQKRNLKQGLETVYLLLTEDVEVQYSPVSEIELLAGKTRGKAFLISAEEGVPDRMWSNIRGEEIQELVDYTVSTELKNKVNEFSAMLDKLGVAVKTDTGEGANKEVMGLAKDINGLVYLSPMDSIIYASSLVAQADYLFTADDYLKKTVNDIRDSDKDSFEDIRNQLRRFVSIITLGNEGNVILPSAHKVTADGTTQPQLNFNGNRH